MPIVETPQNISNSSALLEKVQMKPMHLSYTQPTPL